MLGDEVHLVVRNSCHACLSFSPPLSLSLTRFAQTCLETKYTSLIGILGILDTLAPPSLPPYLSLFLSPAHFAQACLETKYTSLEFLLTVLWFSRADLTTLLTTTPLPHLLRPLLRLPDRVALRFLIFIQDSCSEMSPFSNFTSS